MNIREAKQQIKNAMIAYFTKDEFGNYLLPPERQRPVFLLGAPGIGKKTAQRISLELKDKLAQDALSGAEGLDDAAFAIEPDAPAQDALGEALLALKSLGYTPQEAAAALKGVKGQAETPDELIKLALRHMAQNM